MRKVLKFILFIIATNGFAQSQYDIAFSELKGMLADSLPINFKRAVYATENAYLDNQLDYEEFDKHIKLLAGTCLLISQQSDLIYNGLDKDNVKKYAAVFRLMTDTMKFYQNEKDFYSTAPYKYDFEDFFGDKDWRKMFVSKLLITHTGNCHSLPFLYKMLCEELGTRAHLAMAPNHTYIKLWCEKLGWYNTELTSGYFPIDAWIMASGYVHLGAVQNKIYMDTLSDKQSIAVCLIDLAKGYEKKIGDDADLDFILKCCDLALVYYPKYINALLLKAETLKSRFEILMKKHSVEYPSELFEMPGAKALFESMRKLYVYIHELGYRKMPQEMYLSWLADLKKQRAKYQNHEIQTINRN